jgi:hypothetical protein
MEILFNIGAVIIVFVVVALRAYAKSAEGKKTENRAGRAAPDVPPLFTARQMPQNPKPQPARERPRPSAPERAAESWAPADTAWETASFGITPEKRLEQLQRLYESGLITKEELSAKRAEILRGR